MQKNRTMDKKFLRFMFENKAERNAALTELSESSNYRHLITKTSDNSACFYLFVQATGSIAIDLAAKNSITAIVEKHGGCKH